MAALTHAQSPTASVSEIPGRFAPIYIHDKRNMAAVTTSTPITSVNAYLPRTDTADANFSTPTTEVIELGANFQVGEYDDLPDSKMKLTSYDVSSEVISLICGKYCPKNTQTIFTYNDLSNATVDLVQQFADPNGNIFMSMYMDTMLIDEFDVDIKAKSAAMEMYSLAGFNQIFFRGFFITKAYVVQAADVTAGSFSLAATFGVNEAPVPLPVPTGSQPASYWIQRGCLNFLKIDRWRASQGWQRFPEVTGTPNRGYTVYNPVTATLEFVTGDIQAGDVFYCTYQSYASNVGTFTAPAVPGAPTITPSTTGGTLAASTTVNYRIVAIGPDENTTLPGPEAATNAVNTGTTSSNAISWTAVPNAIGYQVYGRNAGQELLLATTTTNSFVDDGSLLPAGVLPVISTVTSGIAYNKIPQFTPDTGDPSAIPTRLTPFTISANLVARGQSLSLKLALKRDRAEGIGDVDGIWGPPEAPALDVDFDVKTTDFGLFALLTTGSIYGTDQGGPTAGDNFDPNYMTRVGLAADVPLVATLYDPRAASNILKTYTCPTVVFKTMDQTASAKNPVTTKLTGTDRVGNLTIAVNRGNY